MVVKHCCWGICKSDSRRPKEMPDGTSFISFAKPGKIRDGMTEWEIGQAKLKMEKAKRWLYLCGRKDFCKVDQITKDTYICSLHFDGSKGPTEEHPDPILDTLSKSELARSATRKRKAPKKQTLDKLPSKKKIKMRLWLTFQWSSLNRKEKIVQLSLKILMKWQE